MHGGAGLGSLEADEGPCLAVLDGRHVRRRAQPPQRLVDVGAEGAALRARRVRDAHLTAKGGGVQGWRERERVSE